MIELMGSSDVPLTYRIIDFLIYEITESSYRQNNYYRITNLLDDRIIQQYRESYVNGLTISQPQFLNRTVVVTPLDNAVALTLEIHVCNLRLAHHRWPRLSDPW